MISEGCWERCLVLWIGVVLCFDLLQPVQVGATAFVGLLEGGRGISWTVLSKSVFGWVFTLIIVGFVSAILMALGIFTPNLNSLQGVTEIKKSLNGTRFDEVVAWRSNPLCNSAEQQVQLEVRLLSAPR